MSDYSYQTVHNAIAQLKNHEPLTKEQNDAIFSLVSTTIGDKIPTHSELRRYKRYVNELTDELRENNSVEYDRIMDEVLLFENKYIND